MKKFSLRFVQIAWVAETIAVLLFTMSAVIILPVDRVTIWLQFVPAFGLLIGAQGVAGGAGPLVSDKLKNGGRMNEKNLFLLNLVIVIVAVFSVGAIGFFIGRGNLQRSAQPADIDRRIELALAESRRELEQERAISNGLRAVRDRERSVIGGIADATRQARMDARAAQSLGGGAADSLQKIIVQMEIFNRYVGDIERRLAGYRDVSGSE